MTQIPGPPLRFIEDLVDKYKKQNFCFWVFLRKKYWIESSTFSIKLLQTLNGHVPPQPYFITTKLLSVKHRCRAATVLPRFRYGSLKV